MKDLFHVISSSKHIPKDLIENCDDSKSKDEAFSNVNKRKFPPFDEIGNEILLEEEFW